MTNIEMGLMRFLEDIAKDEMNLGLKRSILDHDITSKMRAETIVEIHRIDKTLAEKRCLLEALIKITEEGD